MLRIEYRGLLCLLLVILLVVTFIGTLINRSPGELSLVPVASVVGQQAQLPGGELRQLNQQQAVEVYRSTLTEIIEKEILSQEEWIPVSINLEIEEDQTSPLFGSIYRALIKIKAAGETPETVGRSIKVEPVRIGFSGETTGESESHRVLELESALAQRLQLPARLIEVWVIN